MRTPITLLLDDERSDREKLLVDELESKGRGRQEFLRELLLAAFELYRDDPNRFKILHATLTFSEDLGNGFSRLNRLLEHMDLDSYTPKKHDEAVEVKESKEEPEDSTPTPSKVRGYVQ